MIINCALSDINRETSMKNDGSTRWEGHFVALVVDWIGWTRIKTEGTLVLTDYVGDQKKRNGNKRRRRRRTSTPIKFGKEAAPFYR